SCSSISIYRSASMRTGASTPESPPSSSKSSKLRRMAAPTVRRALKLLPANATTGIGSLPHTQQELALQMALQLDVPFCPQLPIGHASELMISSALDGLPGLSFDSEGVCTVDVDAWAAAR